MSGSLNIASPTGAETVAASNTGALLASVSVAQLRDSSGYSKNAPQSGATLTFGNGQSVMQVSGSGTISALTIVMCPGPVDGERALIFANQIITTLTLSANAGQTMNGAVTTLAQNADVEYLYSASNTTWDRIS